MCFIVRVNFNPIRSSGDALRLVDQRGNPCVVSEKQQIPYSTVFLMFRFFTFDVVTGSSLMPSAHGPIFLS